MFLFFPPMRCAYRDHRSQNGVPSLLLQHHLVREHAAIPANVSKGLRQSPVIVPKPMPGISGNIQFPVGIVWQAMLAGFIVGAAALDRGIVLSNVEVDGPWA